MRAPWPESVGSTVSVELGFQLEPENNFTQAVFVTAGAPILLHGDRALLLMSKDPTTGQLMAGTSDSAFAETATGAISSPPGSAPFSDQINGHADTCGSSGGAMTAFHLRRCRGGGHCIRRHGRERTSAAARFNGGRRS